MYELYPACPLCEAANARLLGTADCTKYVAWHEPLPRVLEWLQCQSCGHVHTRHYWTKEGLAELFRNTHPTQVANIAGNLDAKRAMWAPVIERILDLRGGFQSAMNCAKPPVWLDVGCGDGSLMMTAEDFGFAAIGVDARAETSKQLRDLGFNVVHSEFEDLALKGTVDVLSMMDILEHVPYPKEALAKAARIVRRGGLIVLSMPDRSCSTWRLLDSMKANPYWIELEHHHNFSRPHLMTLLSEAGFEPVSYSIPFRYKAQMEIYARRVATMPVAAVESVAYAMS
jgi:protein O-GlcNAc transferase